MDKLALTDVLLPQRWRQVQRLQGERNLRLGRDYAERGQAREALAHLAHGLARLPADQSARVLYARIVLAVHGPDHARRVLIDGLQHHPESRDYLHATFTFLSEIQKDDEIAQLARKMLRRPAISADCAEVAALAAAIACYHRGKYDEAEKFLNLAPGLASKGEAGLLAAKLEWERGYRDLALLQLRVLSERFPREPALKEELIARLNQSGRHDEARRHALELQIAHPERAAARIELLHAYHRAGDPGAVAREASLIRRDFAQNSSVLLAAADFAANTGNPGLALEFRDHVERHKIPAALFAWLHVEALLTARSHAVALDTLHRLQSDHPEWVRDHPGLHASFQSVAFLGTGDRESARLALSSLLAQRTLRAQNLLTLADRFASLDAADDACRILARAIEADPLNQAALARLIELELNLNRIDELPPHLLEYTKMRKPSPDILRVAHHKLGSDLFLFSPTQAAALDAVQATLDAAEGSSLARR